MIGELKERAILLIRSATPDGGGGETLTWLDGETVAVASEDLSARSVNLAGRRLAIQRRRFLMRARDGLAAGGRLEHRGTVFRIRTIRRREDAAGFLVIDTEEAR